MQKGSTSFSTSHYMSKSGFVYLGLLCIGKQRNTNLIVTVSVFCTFFVYLVKIWYEFEVLSVCNFIPLTVCLQWLLLLAMLSSGLLVSTPTGSTAYSMSAGASILNAAVPALLITPINPHALSCRPLVLPMGTRLEVSINSDARSSTMHLSNDGRLSHRHVLRKGDRVVITASHYPFPCFCPKNQVGLRHGFLLFWVFETHNHDWKDGCPCLNIASGANHLVLTTICHRLKFRE